MVPFPNPDERRIGLGENQPTAQYDTLEELFSAYEKNAKENLHIVTREDEDKKLNMEKMVCVCDKEANHGDGSTSTCLEPSASESVEAEGRIEGVGI
ncbi:hypothetical protein K3495_g13580 [Podosphaera aphanis]|nr:hypothetical protein K3495_g13580 [Podosphaera aphanis]